MLRPTWCHKPCTGNTSNTNRAILSERNSKVKHSLYTIGTYFRKPFLWFDSTVPDVTSLVLLPSELFSATNKYTYNIHTNGTVWFDSTLPNVTTHKSCLVTERYFPLAPVTNHRVAALRRRVSNFGLISSFGSPWIQFNLYSCCLDSRWPPAHLWYHLRSNLKLGQYWHISPWCNWAPVFRNKWRFRVSDSTEARSLTTWCG